jgi:hypothetical protein
MLSCLWNIESAGVGPWATRAGFPKLFKILTAYLPLFKKPINGFAEAENRRTLETYTQLAELRPGADGAGRPKEGKS